MISIEDFKKVEIKAGKILTVERVPETDKLLRFTVDLGEAAPRQIISGIALYFPDPQVLAGKMCTFVTNLEPRMIRGLESNGMILALSTETEFALLQPSSDIPPGTSVR